MYTLSHSTKDFLFFFFGITINKARHEKPLLGKSVYPVYKRQWIKIGFFISIKKYNNSLNTSIFKYVCVKVICPKCHGNHKLKIIQ
jgi:hypothetical protein